MTNLLLWNADNLEYKSEKIRGKLIDYRYKKLIGQVYNCFSLSNTKFVWAISVDTKPSLFIMRASLRKRKFKLWLSLIKDGSI